MESLVVAAGVIAFAIASGGLVAALVRREEQHRDVDEQAREEAERARRAQVEREQRTRNERARAERALAAGREREARKRARADAAAQRHAEKRTRRPRRTGKAPVEPEPPALVLYLRDPQAR